MTTLPGERPLEHRRSFHGPKGEHRFPHPRTYEPRRSAWSTWERRYAEHLDRHAELAANPEPMEGDPPVVVSLFAHIEALKAIIEKEKMLITAVRQKLAAGAEPDDKELDEVRRVLREEGVS